MGMGHASGRSWAEQTGCMVMTLFSRLSFVLQNLSSNVYYFYNQKKQPINSFKNKKSRGKKSVK